MSKSIVAAQVHALPVKRSEKKEKQWACKPGSVPAEAGACHLSTTPLSRRLYRSTLQLGRAALSRPCALRGGRSRRIAGIHELSSSGVHSTHVAMRLVGSYPTFSPLPRVEAVVFFCTC